MRIRTNRDVTLLQRTDRECTECENGMFLKDGHELVCEQCGYTPSRSGRSLTRDPWESHRREVQMRLDGELDGRPRLVGGYADAYWGDGKYEYHPTEGFHL
jgi:ribosomal protein S27AE